MALADRTLTCRDCNGPFVWTAGEQEFYQRRGLVNEPARCPQCRAQRRRARGEQDPATRQLYPAVCAQCGAETQVPFQPRLGRPVYCSDCFATIRSATRTT